MTTRRDFLARSATASVAFAVSRLAAASALPVRSVVATDHADVAETVRGPLDPAKLGVTLPHEHVADAPSVLDRWPSDWNGRAGLTARAVEKLKAARTAGIDTIVDLTTRDVGRDVRFLEEVSRRSGLNIIACTGQRFFPPKTQQAATSQTLEGLTTLFRAEIERGIDSTAVKAGVIKIGISGARPTDLEELGLRAAARASNATGVAIRVHTDAARRAGESDAVILEKEGVDPARVSFDHSDDSGDMNYFLGLVRRGYSLGMDHLHRGLVPHLEPAFSNRIGCIRQLADAGFADRIFVSTDSELGGCLLPEVKRDWREQLDPSDGMLFVVRTLARRLREVGISEQLLRVIMVDNPRRFFSKVTPTVVPAGRPSAT